MGKELLDLLNRVMQRRRRLPSQMAKDLGISHATVIRWMQGKSKPGLRTCMALAEYSGEPLMRVLSVAGHANQIPLDGPTHWPPFGEYVRRKYPNILDEDVIGMIESHIERKRGVKT